ncbi:MAG: MFS transporter [Erysipelotrichaceae bacterium]|nr:MFS transporter [Erysipelotrichaceae bacterium]
MSRKEKLQYVIVVVLCCMSVTGLIGVANSYSLFYTPMTQIWNVPRVTATFHVTLSGIVSGFVTPIIGKYSKRHNMRPVFIAGLAVYLLSMVGIANTSNMFLINALSVIKGIGSSCLSIIFVTSIINAWFIKSRATIVGIVLSFSGIGGAVFSPILQKAISTFGFKTSYLGCAVITCLMCAPFALFCPRTPEEIGMKPFGHDEKTAVSSAKGFSMDLPFITFSAPYILLVLSSMAVTSILNIVAHLPSFALEQGYTAEIGAAQLSSVMIGNICFKLLMGVLIDRFNAYFGYSFVMILSVAGAVAILINRSSSLIYIACGVLYGACYSASTVALPALYSRFYSNPKLKG